MSKPATKTELITTQDAASQQAGFDLSPDQYATTLEDALSIAVASAEQRCRQQLQQARQQIRELEGAREKHAAAQERLCQTEAERLMAPAAAAFRKLLAAAGHRRYSLEMQGSLATSGTRRKDAHLPNRLRAVVTAVFWTDGVRNYAAVPRVWPLPASLRASLAAGQSLSAQLEAAQQTALEWRQRQANIPMLERQHRARLAERRLKAAAPELLQELQARIESDILALPTA